MPARRGGIPYGHGELLTEPPFEQWADAARANAAAASSWDFELCGKPVGDVRRMARAEAIERAARFSARMGIRVREPETQPALLVMAGHQPEFYHPGVWVKDFLLQRLADETGATALDLVVDSDAFDAVELHAPCLKPEVKVCRSYLALGSEDACYARTAVPAPEEIESFCEGTAEQLATLPAPAVGHHFATFCANLRLAARDAENLAELVTFARRRYEAIAGTDYLELPVTSMAASSAFLTLLGHIALEAERFAADYNAALASHRERTGVRSSVQPFPDLRIEEGLVELPFWHLDGARRTLWVRLGPAPQLVADGEVLCEIERCETAGDALAASPLQPAPKAVALTMYARMLVADYFIHGVGGGRYDQVTDELIRRFFGVEPPAFAVASMTMYLPLGARVVRDGDVENAAMALNRLKHNPDQMLGEIEFGSAAEYEQAIALAERKSELVAAIGQPGADKKALGAEIREVNAALAGMLEPFERELAEELDELRGLQAASEILTDRTYPFCFWSPLEVADKVR